MSTLGAITGTYIAITTTDTRILNSVPLMNYHKEKFSPLTIVRIISRGIKIKHSADAAPLKRLKSVASPTDPIPSNLGMNSRELRIRATINIGALWV